MDALNLVQNDLKPRLNVFNLSTIATSPQRVTKCIPIASRPQPVLLIYFDCVTYFYATILGLYVT